MQHKMHNECYSMPIDVEQGNPNKCLYWILFNWITLVNLEPVSKYLKVI